MISATGHASRRATTQHPSTLLQAISVSLMHRRLNAVCQLVQFVYSQYLCFLCFRIVPAIETLVAVECMLPAVSPPTSIPIDRPMSLNIEVIGPLEEVQQPLWTLGDTFLASLDDTGNEERMEQGNHTESLSFATSVTNVTIQSQEAPLLLPNDFVRDTTGTYSRQRRSAVIPSGKVVRVSETEVEDIRNRLASMDLFETKPLSVCSDAEFTEPFGMTITPSYRRFRTAGVMGRIHLHSTEMLIDSGSSISVVSYSFAKRYLSRCRRYRYEGGKVTVADNGAVQPLGFIAAEIQIGSSCIVLPFVVFPRLPVGVLLGTDWLFLSKAVTDWGKQALSFGGGPHINTSLRSPQIRTYNSPPVGRLSDPASGRKMGRRENAS